MTCDLKMAQRYGPMCLTKKKCCENCPENCKRSPMDKCWQIGDYWLVHPMALAHEWQQTSPSWVHLPASSAGTYALRRHLTPPTPDNRTNFLHHVCRLHFPGRNNFLCTIGKVDVSWPISAEVSGGSLQDKVLRWEAAAASNESERLFRFFRIYYL